jgi:glycosyltransferase involved in cell wall biosynthesis
VGCVCHGKGIGVLLQAARQLSRWPVRFQLLGPMRSPELMSGLPENVEWRHSVPHREVADAMRAADALVLPSIEDAYPLVTLEAMACGLPVVVSDNAGTSELITHGIDGLVVQAGQVGSLVAAVQRLVEDERGRRRMGDAARRKVEAGRTWHRYGEDVLELLDGRRRLAHSAAGARPA